MTLTHSNTHTPPPPPTSYHFQLLPHLCLQLLPQLLQVALGAGHRPSHVQLLLQLLGTHLALGLKSGEHLNEDRLNGRHQLRGKGVYMQTTQVAHNLMLTKSYSNYKRTHTHTHSHTHTHTHTHTDLTFSVKYLKPRSPGCPVSKSILA